MYLINMGWSHLEKMCESAFLLINQQGAGAAIMMSVFYISVVVQIFFADGDHIV